VRHGDVTPREGATTAPVRSFAGADEAADWLRENDLTDGLPVVLPTVERTAEFIAATGLSPPTVLGPVEPGRGIATVELVAVCALMAGCRPEHLGVVLAALEAMIRPAFNLRAIQTTTNPVAPLAIVNGPLAGELGISGGRNALGPGRHWNGAVGRAIRLALLNIGQAHGDVDMATLGSGNKYSFCLAEDELSSPWPPLHTSLGYEPDDDVVTVVSIESLVNCCAVFDRADALLDMMLKTMRAPGTHLNYSSGSLIWILSPGHAQILADGGWTREELREYLFEQAAVPLADMPFGNSPAGDWRVVDGRIQITGSPGDIHVMVAGSSEPLHSAYGVGVPMGHLQSARVWRPQR
jgi:hypothetical protein